MLTVKDIMTQAVQVLTTRTSLEEAACMLAQARVGGVVQGASARDRAAVVSTGKFSQFGRQRRIMLANMGAAMGPFQPGQGEMSQRKVRPVAESDQAPDIIRARRSWRSCNGCPWSRSRSA